MPLRSGAGFLEQGAVFAVLAWVRAGMKAARPLEGVGVVLVAGAATDRANVYVAV
jgi:hypothetical protein